MTPQQIKSLRLSLGETQTKFGQRIGVALRTVQDWEAGKRNPSGSARILLATLASDPNKKGDT